MHGGAELRQRRAIGGRILIAERAPGDLDTVFFTNGGAEATENAADSPSAHRPPEGAHHVSQLPRRHRRRDHVHGRAAPLGQRARMARSRALLRALPLPLRVPCHHRHRGVRARARAPRHRGDDGKPVVDCRDYVETVVGTNGVLVPPDGYLEGVRELCDRHGILFIADEVMSGFGRCGEWFAVQRWDVTPISSPSPRV